MKRLKKIIFCLGYYGFARWLPASTSFGGRVSRSIRAFFCSRLFLKCGKKVNVERGAYFFSGRGITIGNNSGIGINAYLAGKIWIGSNVMMAPEVIILTQNHRFENTAIPISQQGFQKEKPVYIEDDVWIGTRVIILPGVRIGRGVVIGAGAVVAKDIPDWAVVVGNPARIVKMRKSSEHERAKDKSIALDQVT